MSILDWPPRLSQRQELWASSLGWVSVSGPIMGAFFYFAVLYSRRRFYYFTLAATQGNQARSLQASLEEDFVIKLVKINFTFIERYYAQTQLQAGRSFNLTLVIAVISFCLIVAGIFRCF